MKRRRKRENVRKRKMKKKEARKKERKSIFSRMPPLSLLISILFNNFY